MGGRVRQDGRTLAILVAVSLAAITATPVLAQDSATEAAAADAGSEKFVTTGSRGLGAGFTLPTPPTVLSSGGFAKTERPPTR